MPDGVPPAGLPLLHVFPAPLSKWTVAVSGELTVKVELDLARK